MFYLAFNFIGFDFKSPSLILLEFLNFLCGAEFWKTIPPSEPYRVIIAEVRDKLYQTRERARHLLSQGISDIPEEATYTSVEQVFTLCVIHYVFQYLTLINAVLGPSRALL